MKKLMFAAAALAALSFTAPAFANEVTPARIHVAEANVTVKVGGGAQAKRRHIAWQHYNKRRHIAWQHYNARHHQAWRHRHDIDARRHHRGSTVIIKKGHHRTVVRKEG